MSEIEQAIQQKLRETDPLNKIMEKLSSGDDLSSSKIGRELKKGDRMGNNLTRLIDAYSLSPDSQKKIFMANSFPIETNSYSTVENYLSRNKQFITDLGRGLYEIPHMSDRKGLMDVFFKLTKYTPYFKREEIVSISRIAIQKTCAVEENYQRSFANCVDGEMKLVMVIKKDEKSEQGYSIKTNDVMIIDNKSFGTIADSRFVNFTVEIGTKKKRGKLVTQSHCEAFVICINFVPSKENFNAMQSFVMNQDPRDPVKSVLNVLKGVNSEEVKKMMRTFGIVKEEGVDENLVQIQPGNNTETSNAEDFE